MATLVNGDHSLSISVTEWTGEMTVWRISARHTRRIRFSRPFVILIENVDRGGMRRFLRNHVGPMFAMVAAALLMLLSAPAATAAPTITEVICESGLNNMRCEVSYTGAVGTVTVRWDAYTSGVHRFTRYGWLVTFGCSPGTWYTMKVFVTDSTGTTQATTSAVCRSGSWQ